MTRTCGMGSGAGVDMTEHDPPNGALSLLADVFRRRRTGILALGPDQARLGLAVRQGHIVGVCNDRAAEEPAPPPDDSVRLRLQRVLDDLGLASPRRAAAPAPAPSGGCGPSPGPSWRTPRMRRRRPSPSPARRSS